MEHGARLASPPWAELPADVLSVIAGHLHDAGDFVRFRTVCRPWRGAPPPPRASSFLPWVVESSVSYDDPIVRLHSPFSTRKLRHLMPLSALRGKTIQRSNASSGRVLTTGYSNEGRTVALINPLNGDATSLPPLPQSISPGDKWQTASGVVCSNGVVVFHTNQYDYLAAVLLRPGGPGWEEVDMTCPIGADTMYLREDKRRAAALWSSAILPGVACGIATLPPRPHGESDRYVLEFRGELLCVDIIVPQKHQPAGVTPPKPVSVHTMQVKDDGWHQWVEREHRRDTDHLCVFLSSNSSFAVDAREFAGSAEVTGGCAYFFGWHPEWTESKPLYGVFRYNFQSGTATLVDQLPTFIIPMWFMPRPRISPLRPRVQ